MLREEPGLPPSHLVHSQEVELLLEVVGHLELPPLGLQGDDLAFGPLGQVPLAPVANTCKIDFNIITLNSPFLYLHQKRSTTEVLQNLPDPKEEIPTHLGTVMPECDILVGGHLVTWPLGGSHRLALHSKSLCNCS